jgi:uncharacterized protein YkwD
VGGLVLVAVAGSAAVAEEPATSWASWSASPVACDDTVLSPFERDALARCGADDAGLRDTARALLARKLRGSPLPELDGVAFAQRAAGEPHPWARVWAATARSLEPDVALDKLTSWLAEAHEDVRLRRCGVASGVGPDGQRSLVVVVVDALADLAPLPIRARPGQWLTIEARLRVPARGGRVLVLGPSGPPRVLMSSFDGRTIRAPFAPDRPGAFAVQVVAELASGPRPVLEASVFADAEPPAHEETRVAPGEDALRAPARADDALARTIDAARVSEGLPPLVRDARLDAVAREHAAQMARANQLAHDAGDGAPSERLRAAGLDAADAGENVAQAPTLALAHRATWASPSHRANILGRAYDRMGVGVSRDGQGDVWIVETFAGGAGLR